MCHRPGTCSGDAGLKCSMVKLGLREDIVGI